MGSELYGQELSKYEIDHAKMKEDDIWTMEQFIKYGDFDYCKEEIWSCLVHVSGTVMVTAETEAGSIRRNSIDYDDGDVEIGGINHVDKIERKGHFYKLVHGNTKDKFTSELELYREWLLAQYGDEYFIVPDWIKAKNDKRQRTLLTFKGGNNNEMSEV